MVTEEGQEPAVSHYKLSRRICLFKLCLSVTFIKTKN